MILFPTAPMVPLGVKTAITVTSPVGKDSRGFSLVELVLVLVVIGISMAIVVPNIGRRLQEREVRSSALGLAAVARRSAEPRAYSTASPSS